MIVRLLKALVLTGIPFGLIMGLLFSWRYGSDIGFISGVACGVSFGLAIAIFVETQRHKMMSTDNTFEGEEVIHQDAANHFLNGEGRGGWLTLTSMRLAFRSHGNNIQNESCDINVNEMVEAIPVYTARVIPNGLRVETKEGDRQSFVVSNRKQWATLINEQINTN